MKNNSRTDVSTYRLILVWTLCLASTATIWAQTPLRFIAPTYNCSTGAITFNTLGGDGSPITYSAPGITRSSVFSNSGAVEEGLRRDPKPIPITATQSGYTASYTFDIISYCSVSGLQPPELVSPIANLTVTAGETLERYAVSQQFRDPNVYHGIGYSLVSFGAVGTPPGLEFRDATMGPSTNAYFTGVPAAPGVYSVTVTCYFYRGITGELATSNTFTITVLGKPVNPTDNLVLTQPTYNCATGEILFRTSGGDGSPIEFMAPGITGWTTKAAHVLDQCARTCNDIPPFVISARQSGRVVSYVWSRQNYCNSANSTVSVRTIPDQTVAVGQSVYFTIGLYFSSAVTTSWAVNAQGLPPGVSTFFRQEGGGSPNPTRVLDGKANTPRVYTVTASASANGGGATTTFKFTVTGDNPSTGNALALASPTYNCSTGAIRFNTTGGDGSPIEFMAPGITGWTTNPDQFVDKDSRTANDVKPFTLTARQSGKTVTLVWDLKAACGRARAGVEEIKSGLTLTVLGNPVQDQLRVLVEGVDGESVQLWLSDLQGRTLESRRIEQVSRRDEQVFRVDGKASGVLLLQAVSGNQKTSVKILK